MPTNKSNKNDPIRDIVVNPDEWRIAYAIDRKGIYRTKDGTNGIEWDKLNVGNLSSLTTELYSIEIYNPSNNPNDEVLIVGARGGVFYTLNPRSTSPVWRELGGSGGGAGRLPNAVAYDVHYDAGKDRIENTSDDLIYVGTYGRGVWRLNNPMAALSGVLTVDGTANNDSISIKLHDMSTVPTLDVTVNGVTDSFAYRMLDKIRINGLGGNDTITIDSSNGVIGTGNDSREPSLIIVDGGTGTNTLKLTPNLSTLAADVVGPDTTGAGGVQLRRKGTRASKPIYSNIQFANITNPIDSQIANNPVTKLGYAFEKIAAVSKTASSKGGNLGTGNIIADLSGTALIDSGPLGSDPITAVAERGIVQEGLGEIAGPFFESIGFTLDDIGETVTDPDMLRTKLDDLDSKVGNVIKTDQNGILKYDIEINKQIAGLSLLDLGLDEGAFAGLVTLEGGISLTADATMRLIVGVDAQGKIFIDPAGALDANNDPIPFIKISNIQGTADGSGRIGMFEVEMTSATLTTDPDLMVNISLIDPNPDDSDLMIRLEDLDLEDGELFTVAMTASPEDAVPDVSLTGHFNVKVFNTTLFSDRQLTIQWPDAANPRQGTIVPGGSDSSIFNTLAASIDQITSGIQLLASTVEDATGTDILAAKIPLLNKTLGEVLNQQADPLVVAANTLYSVTTPESDGETGENTFTVRTLGNDLRDQGLKVGADVLYTSSSGLAVTGILKSFDGGGIVISYLGSLAVGTPGTTTSYSLPRSGGLAARLRDLSEGVNFKIPTLQELIDHIADITRIESIRNVQVVGTFGQSDFGIQFPIQFVPDPIKYQIPLDFAEQIASLKLDASAIAQVVVQPTFNLTVGISLAAKKADGTDFSPLERVYIVATSDPNPTPGSAATATAPIVGVNVTLQLDNPSLMGSVGFLDVTLAETSSVTPNKGIKLDLLGSIHFVDPDVGVADQRIPLNLFINNFANIVDFDFDGSLDIDGLTAAASVGSFNAIAGVNISLEGEGGDAAPGHFENLAELGQVLGRIQVGAFTNFDQFKNISAADVLAALDLLVTKLQETGHGDVFSKPIPIVNRSVSDLIDLGQVFLDTIGKPDNDSSTATAAKLQAFINAKLVEKGLPANVEIILSSNAVRFKFSAAKSYSRTVPIAFQVGNGGISIDGNANLALTAIGTLNLTFGILTTPGVALADRFFLDTNNVSPAVASGIDVRLEANVGYVTASQPVAPTPLALDIVLGPIGFHVTDGRVLVGMNVGANLTTSDSSKRITLNSLGSASILPTFNGTVQAIFPIDGDNSGGTVGSRPNTLTGDDALILVGGKFTGLTSLVPVFATTSTLALPSGLTTPIADNALPTQLRIEGIKVVELINKQFLNFGTLIEGLERLLEWGDRALNIDILNRKIPFLGKSVHDGLNFLESDQPGAKTLRTVIQALVTNGGDGLKTNASNAAVDAALTLLRNTLGGIPGITPLGDFDGVTGLSNNDLIVPTKNGSETTGVLVRFKYNPTFTTNRPFDLGIDFLNLNGSGNVALNGNLELNIGFGVSKTEGFFFITDLPQPEFKIGGTISPSLTLAAKLGRLDVDLAINAGSYASIDFSMNIVDPSGDGKLTLSELTNFSQISTIIPSNNLQLNVETHLVGTFATRLDSNNQLPSFSAGVNVDWRVADTSQTDGFRGIDILHLSTLPADQKVPQVKIVNVVLDVGSFVTSIVKPIFQKITESGLIPPSLKTALDTDVPLINKKVKDLLREAIVANPNLTEAQKDNRLRVFDLLLNITTFLSNADSLVSQANGDSLKINFGDINVGVNSSDPTKPAPTPTLTDSTVMVTQNGMMKAQVGAVVDIPGSGIPLIKDFIKKLGDMGITFPILRLSNLVQLIVGNDTDIVLINLPEFKIEKTFNQSFPLIGGGIGDIVRLEVAAFLGGGFTFTAHLAGGFDTSGLRKGKFVDGFYLGDFDPNSTGSANGQIDPIDKERPEISFTGFVQAGIVGQAEVLGFNVGKIEGHFQITAEVNVDLNDDNEINGVAPPCDTRTVAERHDGKLHFGEVSSIRQSHGGEFLSILELSGGISAELGLHITVLGGRLYDKQFSKSFELLSFDNFTFPVKCPPSGSADTCSSAGTEGNNLATPVANAFGRFDISIPPQNSTNPHSSDDPLIAIAEDYNGNPFDGGGINTYDSSNFTTAAVFDGVSFTSTQSGVDLANQGVQIGQGVTFMQNGVEMAGVVSSVTANGFIVRNHFGPRPAGPSALAASGSIALAAASSVAFYSPNETLVMQRRGTIESFGPMSCGENAILNGFGGIQGIVTADEDTGLGLGNNRFQAHDTIRAPIAISGGRGNDTIIGGSGPLTALGGPGNDTIQVGTFRGVSVVPAANIKGGSGRDTIFGGRGSDILLGEEGDDLIFDDDVTLSASSPTGNDKVVGGGGRDTIISRGGLDELTGDYHEELDRRPTFSTDQKEDVDIIRHESTDKATIFGNNRGATANAPGVKPNPSRNSENGILTRGTSDEIFSNIGDSFEPTVSKGTIRITESMSNPTIRSTSMTATGLRQLAITASNTIEITDATGILTIESDSVGTTATVSVITNGLKVVFTNGATYNVRGISGLTLTGAGGSDLLVLDFASGNPIPLGGASFVGQTSTRAIGDQIRIIGTGTEILSTPVRGAQTGSFSIGSRSLKFSNVKSVETSKLNTLSWLTAKTTDVYSVQAAVGTGNIAAGQIIGSSGGNIATNWIFFDVPTVTVDVGISDTTTNNDTIGINTNGLLARGLSNLKVLTGDGNDIISVTGNNLNLATTVNRLTIDAGVGLDQFNIGGDVDFSLNGDTNTLSSSMAGSMSLLGLGSDNIRLVGGNSGNRFVLTNWPGAVTLDGAAGTDFLTLTMRGGSVTTVDELNLTTNVTVNTGGVAMIDGRLNFGTSGRTFNVADGSAAVDLIVNAILTGAVGLTKTGAGAMSLLANNTLTGTYTVSAGSLLVDGQQTNAVTLNGGTIGGKGRTGAITGSSGTISPGNSPGILTVAGNVFLTSANSFRAELNGTTAGRAHDQLSVIGTVNLGGNQLVTSVGFSSVPGNTYQVIENDGTDLVVGTFAGIAEGATFVANGFTFRVSYRGGTGNDVVFTHLSNFAPAFQNQTVTPTIDENGIVTITGTITEPDFGDLFTLVVDWSDGNTPEEFNFDPAKGRAVQVQHQYQDDPSDSTLDARMISLLWRDQHGASNIADLITTILNVAPNVAARPDKTQSGTILKAKGQFTDPGTDSWFATVDYGNGQGERSLPLGSDGKFELDYQYLVAGLFNVKVKVTDDDGGVGESSFPVRVETDDDGQPYLLSWQNRRLNVDVNADGEVLPLDVLLVINELSRRGTSDLLPRLSEIDLSNPFYFDSTGDGFLAPLDVLLIINYLTRQAREVAAEGEALLNAQATLAANSRLNSQQPMSFPPPRPIFGEREAESERLTYQVDEAYATHPFVSYIPTSAGTSNYRSTSFDNLSPVEQSAEQNSHIRSLDEAFRDVDWLLA